MNFKKLTSIAFAAALAFAPVAAPLSTIAATTYTPVAGTSCNFNKYFIMDAGDTVPNATFSFTVAPGSARSADTSDNAVMQVLPGVGTPTIADVTFGPSDTTATSASGAHVDVNRNQQDRTGTAGTDTVQLDAGEKFATKQATVDFSSVTFDEPGIYRYIITETANAAHAAQGIVHDTDVDRVLDVYVTDNGSGTLVVSSYVLHTSDQDVTISALPNGSMGSNDVGHDGDAVTDKTDGFTNEYVTKDLVFKKEVTGNQASRDKVFEFTATVTDVNDADVFVVSLANDNDANTTDGNADATSASNSATIAANAGQTNVTSVTGAELKAGKKFYLQHGQSIAIRGLALNAKYNITENAEDYKSTGAGVAEHTDAVSSGNGTISTIAGTNKVVKTSYLNTRQGVIPTGVVSAVAGGLALLGLSAGGLAVLSKKEEDEDDE